jgi:hypothetical protein
MTNYLLIAVLLALALYGAVKAMPLLEGTSLVIDSPADNAAFPGGIVAVRGRAPRAARLSLDGAPLLRDQNGDFSSTLTFPRGGSILTFTATDRFGRTVSATRAIFVPDTADTRQSTTTNH